MGNAMTDVGVEQAEPDAVEGTVDGGDLRKHVDAVALFVDHAREPANLPFDAPESVQDGRPVGAVAACFGCGCFGHDLVDAFLACTGGRPGLRRAT